MKLNKQQAHKVGTLVKVKLYGMGIVVGEGETSDYFDLDGTGTIRRTSQFVYLVSHQDVVPFFVDHIHPMEKEQRA